MDPYRIYLRYALLFGVLYYAVFLQFFHLGELPIVQWDESRLAVNAAEMSQDGNFLVSTFGGKADLYNTKPPLMIWLQVVSIKVFGLNEFAIRFPSALAGFLGILLCAWILFKQTGNLYLSCLVILLLSTSNGWIQLHGSLTGDYDALLALFVLMSIYKFRAFMEGGKNGTNLALINSMALALMCKSAAALIMYPVFVGLLFVHKPKYLPKFIFYCFLSIIPFFTFCLLRENAEAGYLSAIWQNDFLGRFSKPMEGHTSSWTYYIVNLFDFRFGYFIWLLPLSLVFAFRRKNEGLQYYSVCFLLYLVFLSMAKTRIHWYDTPLLPLAAIVITLGLESIYRISAKRYWRTVLPLLISGLLILPMYEKLLFIRDRKNIDLDMGHYELSKLLRAYKGNENVKYIANWYDAEFYFYTKGNKRIKRGKFGTLQKGDTVMMGNKYKDSLNLVYKYQLLNASENAQTIVITGIK